MVSILLRMKVLRGKLAMVRSGYGAAVFPQDVKKISVRFARQHKDGHLGPRKFWRQYLPRMKYHNPNLEVEIIRTEKFGGPCELTIKFDNNRQEKIDCKNKMAAEICKQVLELTKARQLPVSPQDAQLVAEYEKYVKDEEQSAIAKENRRKAKREEKERERLGVVA